MMARRYFVSGRVQGVFYRQSTQDKAVGLGLSGWVRNLPDGRVELVAAGSQPQLAALEAWLHQGPPRASVAAVEIQDAVDEPLPAGFEIR